MNQPQLFHVSVKPLVTCPGKHVREEIVSWLEYLETRWMPWWWCVDWEFHHGSAYLSMLLPNKGRKMPVVHSFCPRACLVYHFICSEELQWQPLSGHVFCVRALCLMVPVTHAHLPVLGQPVWMRPTRHCPGWLLGIIGIPWVFYVHAIMMLEKMFFCLNSKDDWNMILSNLFMSNYSNYL